MRNALLSNLFLRLVLIGCGAIQLQAHPLPLGAPERLEEGDWEAMKSVVHSKGIKDAGRHFAAMQRLYTTTFGSGRFPEAPVDPGLYDQYLLTLAWVYKAAYMENMARPVAVAGVEAQLELREAFLPTFRLFQRIGNTVFSLALRQGIISTLDEAGGLVSLRGHEGSWEKFIIGYTWDEGGLLPQVVPRGVKEIQWMPFPYGLPSPIGQRVLLIEDDRLQSMPGLYIHPLTDERRAILGEGMCLKGYYGRASFARKRASAVSAAAAFDEKADDPGLCSYCRHGVRELFIPETNPLYALLSSFMREREVFLAFPQTRRDADLMYLSLLEDMVREDDEGLAEVCRQIGGPSLAQIKAQEEEGAEGAVSLLASLASVAPEVQEKALQRRHVQDLIADIKEDMAGALTEEYEARTKKPAAASPGRLTEPSRVRSVEGEEKVAEPSRETSPPAAPKVKVKTRGVPYRDGRGEPGGAAAAQEGEEAAAPARLFDSEKVLEVAQLSGRARYREVFSAIKTMSRALGGYGADFKDFIARHSRYKKHRIFSAPGHDVSVLGVPHGKKDLTMPSSRANGLLEDMLAGFETYLASKEG